MCVPLNFLIVLNCGKPSQLYNSCKHLISASINNGLWAKNGFRLQSGILELNSAVENKSGLQFAQLKASNPAGKNNGKVLSVDDNGNVILVKDSVG